MSIETLKNNVISDDFLDYALKHHFGDLHFKVDPDTGMKAIIAIHNTQLGPALGGCRFIEYPNTLSAIEDVMRLAQGMSYKSALANLALGGGKAVIIKPTEAYDRTAYMHHFGRFVNELGGRYVTALDSGTQLSDMDIIAQHTPHVASLSSHNGDPSPSTVKGMLQGIRASVLFKLGKHSLDGLHIAIQGLGHVGFDLAKQLREHGAKITVADVNSSMVEQAVTELNANAVSTRDIHKIPCDVFSPCALGAIINDKTLPELQTNIIAGAANNQLAHSVHGKRLHEKGILYAPDYVINAGGVIYAASQYLHTSKLQVEQQINNIHSTLLTIFTRAQNENKPTSEIADLLAREKLA